MISFVNTMYSFFYRCLEKQEESQGYRYREFIDLVVKAPGSTDEYQRLARFND